jgi:potassium uptake TrkH family protein
MDESQNFVTQNLEKIKKFVLNIRTSIRVFLRKILLVLAIISIVSLIIEFGFYAPKGVSSINRFVQQIILYAFLFHSLMKVILFINDKIFLKNHLGEIFITILIILYISSPLKVEMFFKIFNPNFTTEAITSLYIVTTQLLVIFNLIIGAIKYSQKIMNLNIQPILLMVISFGLIIVMGTLLLLLPKSTIKNISLMDALFTSTSAVCVTGLTVVDTATYFTTTGKTIILLLVQIGGLGIMTLTTFIALLMGNSTQLKEYSAIKTLLGEGNIGKIKNSIFAIGLSTFLIELVGAIFIYELIDPTLFKHNGERIYFAVFHSVSAFCNAGFSLTSDNVIHSYFQFNSGIMLTLMLLIILGGLGFPVISNLGKKFSIFNLKNRNKRKLTFHSKLVLITSLLLIVLGAMLFFTLEYNNSMQQYSFSHKIFISIFHSVSSRTAGFYSVEITKLANSTLFIIIILIWIGASPASTGGGIKTTTFAVSLINILGIASGRNRAELFNREISELSVTKAFCTIILSASYIAFALFLLLLVEPYEFEHLLLEVISAVGTTGISANITPALSLPGKFIIMISMFFGRIGLLSMFLIIVPQKTKGKYRYAQEDIIVF